MIIGLIVLGLAAGVLSGMFGIGGGIVMVPSLIAIFGMDILDANATSLAAMLLPVGILGVIAYYKAGLIDVRQSLWIALGLFAGSFVGGELAVHMTETVLAKLYAALLLYVAVGYFDIVKTVRKWMARKRSGAAGGAPGLAGSAEAIEGGHSPALRHFPFWSYILLGVLAGVVAGLFGKGGGLVIVPALISIFRYDPKAAAATSLAALQLPVGLPSVLIYAGGGHLNVLNAALIASGIVAGAFFGTKLTVRMPGGVFKKIYALFLLAVAAFMLWKYL